MCCKYTVHSGLYLLFGLSFEHTQDYTKWNKTPHHTAAQCAHVFIVLFNNVWRFFVVFFAANRVSFYNCVEFHFIIGSLAAQWQFCFLLYFLFTTKIELNVTCSQYTVPKLLFQSYLRMKKCCHNISFRCGVYTAHLFSILTLGILFIFINHHRFWWLYYKYIAIF